MQLQPCDRCHRHVAVTAPSCPFCGSHRAPGLARLVEHAGRLSRAAVFAGLAACTSNPPPHNIQQQPPPPPPPDATTATVTNTTTFAQPPPDGGQAQPRDGGQVQATGVGSIEGIVKRRGRPASGEAVTLSPGGQRTVTDAKGHYAFTNLPPGNYSLLTTSYDDNPHHPPPPAQPVTVRPDAAAHVDLTIYEPVPDIDNGPCCKPYGAPPARRRVV
jgi:hypothetical protein